MLTETEAATNTFAPAKVFLRPAAGPRPPSAARCPVRFFPEAINIDQLSMRRHQILRIGRLP
jgi:hypothetical protein